MTETAVKGGDAPASEQTENAQSAEGAPEITTQTEAKDTSTKKEPSERFKEISRKRTEAELRAWSLQKQNRELTKRLSEFEKEHADLSDEERRVMKVFDTRKKKELESELAQAEVERRSSRLELFTEKLGKTEAVEAFCKLPGDCVSDELADVVADSDVAAALAARLANNPSEARKLSNMAPHRMGMAVSRIEQELSASPAVRSVSQAPEPSSTLKGGSSPSGKSLYDKNLSMEEYAARRKPELNKTR